MSGPAAYRWPVPASVLDGAPEPGTCAVFDGAGVLLAVHQGGSDAAISVALVNRLPEVGATVYLWTRNAETLRLYSVMVVQVDTGAEGDLERYSLHLQPLQILAPIAAPALPPVEEPEPPAEPEPEAETLNPSSSPDTLAKGEGSRPFGNGSPDRGEQGQICGGAPS